VREVEVRDLGDLARAEDDERLHALRTRMVNSYSP
jgi:hypothetical protein